MMKKLKDYHERLPGTPLGHVLISSSMAAGLCSSLWALVLGAWQWLLKRLLKIVTRTGEVERLLDRPAVDEAMVLSLRKSVLASKVLKRRGIAQIIFGEGAFEVEALAPRIVEAKYIRAASPHFRSRILPNLQDCLHQLNGVNAAIEEMLRLKSTAYSSDNAEHEALLEELWTLLMPEDRRSGRITEEWGTIGFQGTDPATDFRGMGLLGLTQLVMFARFHPVAARQTLQESQHHAFGYPMAITGINLTAWLFDLARKRALDHHFFAAGRRHRGGPGLRDAAALAFHEIYSQLFPRFSRFYLAAQPEDLMSFQSIFKRWKEAAQRELTQQQQQRA
eukprot:g1756.t1